MATAQLPWKRFVAFGDSLTEGVGDPTAEGLRGWADRLADGLREVAPDLFYANLAYRGLTTRQVVESQLAEVQRLSPDLATAVVGMNDLIDPGFDDARYAADLGTLVEPLAAAGVTVLMATYPDVSLHLRVPVRMKARLRERLLAANAVVRRTAESFPSVVFVDADDLVEQSSARSSFSVDRLHPGPLGHLLIAGAFAERLAQRAGVPIPMPDPSVGKHGAGRFAQARWLASNVSPLDIPRFVARLRSSR